MTHRPHRKGTQALHTTHQVMGVFSQFGSKVHNRFIFHGRISNCTCIISPCLSYGAKIFSVHKITQYFLLCGFPCISSAVCVCTRGHGTAHGTDHLRPLPLPAHCTKDNKTNLLCNHEAIKQSPTCFTFSFIHNWLSWLSGQISMDAIQYSIV